MNKKDRQYYDAVMAAYAKGEGRLSFQDRTALSKDRAALGIAASDAMAIEESAKTDYRRNAEERERRQIEKQKLEAEKRMKEAEERLQAESARMAAEQKRTAEALEQRRREEAKAKAEAEERERKRREEREATERAEAEARRLKAEREAREDAERLEQQERKRREKREHEENVEQAKRTLKKILTIAFGVAPLLAAAYTAFRYYQAGHFMHAGVIAGSVLIIILLYYAEEFCLKWLYGLFLVAILCGCVYDYLHLSLIPSASPGWDIFVKDQFTLKLSVVFALVFMVLSAWQSADRGRGVFHIIISSLCCLALVPIFRGEHWKTGVLFAAIVAVQLLGWLFNMMSYDADLDFRGGGLVRPTRWLWLLMCVPFMLGVLAGNSGHWIVATILAIAAGTCITRYETMICGALVLGIILQIVG